MKKQIFAIFLSLCLMIGMFSVTAFAADAVASIGDATYETLSQAITAAANGAEITLLQETTENITVAADKNITINLNNNTLTGRVDNKGTLTLKKGIVNYVLEKNGTSSAISNSGTLVVEECTVNCSGAKGVYGIYNQLEGNATVRSTNINAKTPLQNYSATSVMTVESGTFTSTSTSYADYVFKNTGTAYVGTKGAAADSVKFIADAEEYVKGINNAGTMYVYAATVSANKGIVNGEPGTLYIGEAESTTVNVTVNVDGYSDAYAIDNAGTATVYGGNYTGVSAFHNYYCGTAYLYGGTFQDKLQLDGDTNGVYGVYNEGVMTIGKENASNSLITINSTVEKRFCIYNYGSYANLIVNSGTISSDKNNSYGIYNGKGSELTVNGGTISSPYMGIANSNSSVVINDVHIKNAKYALYSWSGTVEAKGGEYSSRPYDEYIAEGYNVLEQDDTTYPYIIGKGVNITLQGGDGGDTSATVLLDTNKITEITVPTRTGYIFAGWTIEENNEEKVLINEEGNLMPNVEGYTDEEGNWIAESGVTLYALWEEDFRTITFYANDGTETAKTQNVLNGVEATLDENTFERTGHIFEGWATTQDGTVTYTDQQAVTVTENTDLYAVWISIDPPTITTTTLEDGRVGKEYSQELTATGDEPIEWSIKEGTSLPEGLTLEGNIISGTPTEKGTFTFTVVAENEGGAAEQELSITIKAKSFGGNNKPDKDDKDDKVESNKQENETNPNTGVNIFAANGSGYIGLGLGIFATGLIGKIIKSHRRNRA